MAGFQDVLQLCGVWLPQAPAELVPGIEAQQQDTRLHARQADSRLHAQDSGGE